MSEAKPKPEKIPFIEAIIRVSDGSFESRLTVPISATREQLSNVGEMWMKALLQSVRLGDLAEGR